MKRNKKKELSLYDDERSFASVVEYFKIFEKVG